MTPEERAESAYALMMALTRSTDNAIAMRNLVRDEISQALAEDRAESRRLCRQVSAKYATPNEPQTVWDSGASWAAEECADAVMNRRL